MTDPQNVPLDKARPGDMVFLKPLAFDGHSAHGVYVAKPDGQSMGVGFDWIDHIERAPRVLKVGEPAIHKFSGARVKIRLIEDGWAAWVAETSGAAHGWSRLIDLEPVE